MNKKLAVSEAFESLGTSALQSQEWNIYLWLYVFRTKDNSISTHRKPLSAHGHQVLPEEKEKPSIGDKGLEDNMRVDIVNLFPHTSIVVLNLANSFPRSWNESNPLKAQTVPDSQAGRIVGVYEVEDTPSKPQSACIPLKCATQQRP